MRYGLALLIVAVLLVGAAMAYSRTATRASLTTGAVDKGARAVPSDEAHNLRAVNMTHHTLARVLGTDQGRERLASWSNPSSAFTLRFHDQRSAAELFDDARIQPWRDTYESLPTDRARADLWRYAHMWLKGGWYADADTSLNAADGQLPMLHADSPMYASMLDDETLATHIMGAPPGHPAALRAMELVRERVDQLRRGGTVAGEKSLEYLCGTRCFTDAVRSIVDDPDAPIDRWTSGVARPRHESTPDTLANDAHVVIDPARTGAGNAAFDCVTHGFDGGRADGWRADARACAATYDRSDDPLFGQVAT